MSFFDFVDTPNIYKKKDIKIKTSHLNTLLKGTNISVRVYREESGWRGYLYNGPQKSNHYELYYNVDGLFSKTKEFAVQDTPIKGILMKPGKKVKEIFNNNRYCLEIKTKTHKNRTVLDKIRVKPFYSRKIQEFDIKEFKKYLNDQAQLVQENYNKIDKTGMRNIEIDRKKDFYKKHYYIHGKNNFYLLQVDSTKSIQNFFKATHDGWIEFHETDVLLREENLNKLANDLKITVNDKLLQYQTILIKIQTEFFNLTSTNLLDSPTISTASFNNIKNIVPKKRIQIYQNLMIEKLCRDAYRAPKCLVSRKESNVPLYAMDFKSQFPSAMYLFPYPSNDVYVVKDLDLRLELFNSHSYKHLGIFTVDMVCTKQCLVPIVSEKENGFLTWDFRDRKEITLSSVEIEDALKYNNYKITKIHNGIEWKTKEFLFDKIKDIYDWKLKAEVGKMAAMRMIAKLILTSGYGGFGRKPILEKTKYVTEEEYDNFKYPILDETMSNDSLTKGEQSDSRCESDKIWIKYKKPLEESDIDRPSYIAVFIVSYAKRMMNMVTDLFDGFNDPELLQYYTDTDSLYVNEKVLNILKKSTIKYPRLDQPIPVIGDRMGQMGDDLKNNFKVPITKAYFPYKKDKLLILGNGDIECTMKGLDHKIRKSIPKEDLEEIYKNKLNGIKKEYTVKRTKKDGDCLKQVEMNIKL